MPITSKIISIGTFAEVGVVALLERRSEYRKNAKTGNTVMAVDETEAAFNNVIGNQKPDELEKVMDHFDVDIDE